MTPTSVATIEQETEVPIYPKRGLTVVRGSGAELIDDEGKSYVDLISGIGVASIGHAHPRLAETLMRQAGSLLSCPGTFSNPVRAQLLKRLVDITPDSLDQVYLGNSGTESVEAALKFAQLSTGKSEVIAAMRGFHGRTKGALAVTFDPKYRNPFEPLTPTTFVPFNQIDKMREAITDQTGAVILELIQGNGGVHLADKEYIQQVRQLCDEHDIILIFDEVQTGLGRTGMMFAFQHYHISPDILCLAKALGGGIPISATIINSSKIHVDTLQHGSTFGGNPLAAAAALTTLDIIEEEHLCERAAEYGIYFQQKLIAINHRKIREIRGMGLLIGIELRIRANPVLRALQDHGYLAGSAGSTVIRIIPPLVITKDQIDRFVNDLVEILKDMGS